MNNSESQSAHNSDAEIEVRTTVLEEGATATSNSPTFEELGVAPTIVDALKEKGITHTFAIQELTLPLALNGQDLIGQARTGMGKTYGFGVPMLNRLATADASALDGTPRGLVVVPTRELCIQVEEDLAQAASKIEVDALDDEGTPTGKKRPLSVLAIYGGTPYEPQVKALHKGVDVVVGTPGRLVDLAQQNHLVLGKVAILVLDEADEMLDLGFLPDMERILSMVPEKRQTMLFSATMPGPIITLARNFLLQPTHIRAESVNASATHESTKQFAYRAHALNKPEVVARILQAKERGKTMIFTRTKRTAQSLAEDLAERGFKAATVHGDLGQSAREEALDAFRAGGVDVLVATDVAARGIDVDDVTHVINYQCPDDDKTYIHRIGRTGRAGRGGVAVSLVDWDDVPRWMLIDKALELGIGEPVETYHTSDHLYEDLCIRREVEGSVGPARDLIGGRRRRRGQGKGRGQGRGNGRGARSKGHGSKDAQSQGSGKGKGQERREIRGRARQRQQNGEGAKQESGGQQRRRRRRRRTHRGKPTN